MNNTQVLILAGGKGKRLNSQTQKALYPILGKPIICYILENLKKAGFKKPVVVIGHKGKEVQKTLKDEVFYVWQRKRLGTGHAVLCAKKLLEKKGSVLILCSDMPFWKAKTFKKLIKEHQKSKAVLSLVSVIFENPSFFQYGRILRDKKGKVLGIIEEKEATSEQKKIKECNPACYLIKTGWLFKNLSKIKKSSCGEYYLTDILGLAVSQDKKINVVPTSDWKEAIGINTKEQLEYAEKILEQSQRI